MATDEPRMSGETKVRHTCADGDAGSLFSEGIRLTPKSPVPSPNVDRYIRSHWGGKARRVGAGVQRTGDDEREKGGNGDEGKAGAAQKRMEGGNGILKRREALGRDFGER